MLLLVHGEDDFLVGRRRQALVQAFRKKYPEGEVFVFDFEDQGSLADVKRFLEACAGGLFASQKMVVVLHPFVLKDSAQKLFQDFLKEETARLEQTILLLVHGGKIKKTDPVTKVVLSKMDKEEVCSAPAPTALKKFLAQELAAINEHVSLSEEAIRTLSSLAHDTGRMLGELEKLASYKGEGVITGEDVSLFLQVPEENVIWNALDALGRGEQEKALLLFRKEAKKGNDVYPILALCAWQVRRLLLMREAFDHGARRVPDIVAATKLPPFSVQKALPTLGNFSLSRIKKGLALLSDIDTALKQGKADPEVSLDLFVWKF